MVKTDRKVFKEKYLYSVARHGVGKDVLWVRLAKDRDGNVLISEESVLRRL